MIATAITDVVNFAFSHREYAELAASALGATVTLSKGVELVKNRLEGIPQIGRNAAAIKRHAINYDVLDSYITQEGGPESILMEGADLIYFAVRNEDPPILKFNIHNKKDALAFQQVLLHLDEPHRAHAIVTGHEKPSYDTGGKCKEECAELSKRIRRRQERSWIRNRNDEKNTAIDTGMLEQIATLADAKEGVSMGMTESCHISLKHTASPDSGSNIILMGITTQFQRAFKKAHGVRDIGTLTNTTSDNALFEKILETRRAMANHTSRLSALFQKVAEFGFRRTPESVSVVQAAPKHRAP